MFREKWHPWIYIEFFPRSLIFSDDHTHKLRIEANFTTTLSPPFSFFLSPIGRTHRKNCIDMVHMPHITRSGFIVQWGFDMNFFHAKKYRSCGIHEYCRKNWTKICYQVPKNAQIFGNACLIFKRIVKSGLLRESVPTKGNWNEKSSWLICKMVWTFSIMF